MPAHHLVGNLVERRLRSLDVGCGPEVHPEHHALVFEDHTLQPQPGQYVLDLITDPGHELLIVGRLLGQRDGSTVRVLGTVRTPYLDLGPEPVGKLASRTTGHDRHQAEPPPKLGQQFDRAFQGPRIGWDMDDLGQRAVEVGKYPCRAGPRTEGGDRGVAHRPSVAVALGASYTRRVRTRALAITLLLLAACRPDSIELAYRFDEGRTITYRMTATANAEWDIAGPGQGSYEVGFEVQETVRSADETGATVIVEMIPIPDATEERGLPSPGLERRSFSLRVGPSGELLEVLEVDGIEASVLNQDEIALIGTYRPPLPTEEVRLRDDWSDQREVQLGANFRQIETTGTLIGYRRAGERRLARITFSGRGPVEWISELPQGRAQLTGEARTTGSGFFDVDGGSFDEATSLTSGSFEVRVLPGGGEAPITGILELELEVTIERLS